MDTWGYNGKTERKHEDLLATGRSSKNLEIHTLDKNGSLYDPAGTESWNMQTSLDR